ncbi:MAG: hypothetical protein AB7T06_10880 [Kofleriaceae bacterium]
MKKFNDDQATLDIITREVALLELEDGHTTPDDRRWAEGVVRSIDEQITERRRARIRKPTPPIKKAPPITERLLAMPRAALEALYELVGRQAQVAHRNLDTLSDNDLRRLIQTIESRTHGAARESR